MSPLADIHQYPSRMKITQVLKFLEKKGVAITRSMIQNYIRYGLLSPPLDKRVYTHKHLAAIVLIERLKSVFDLQSILAALTPHMDEEGIPLDVFENIWQSSERLAQTFFEEVENGNPLLAMSCTAALKAKIV